MGRRGGTVRPLATGSGAASPLVTVGGAAVKLDPTAELMDDLMALVKQAQVVLTHDQILSLAENSFELVPAPGEERLLLFSSAVAVIRGDVDANGNLLTTYGNVSSPNDRGFWRICWGDYDWDASAFAALVIFEGVGGMQVFQPAYWLDALPLCDPNGRNDYPFQFRGDVVNKPFKLCVNNTGKTGDFTFGNPANTLIVSVAYMVLDLATGLFI